MTRKQKKRNEGRRGGNKEKIRKWKKHVEKIVRERILRKRK